MQALVRELDGALGVRRPRVGVVALQEDKPVAAMLEALAPALDVLVATTSGHAGHARALPPRRSPTRRATAGFADVVAEPEPFIALAQARGRPRASWARSSSPDRSTCSSVCAPRRWRPASMPRRRSLWRVFVLILGLILLTIAVFYAIGYALAKAIV